MVMSQDKLFGGLGGDDGNCGCPCREYFVNKCDTVYKQHCYQVRLMSFWQNMCGSGGLGMELEFYK